MQNLFTWKYWFTVNPGIASSTRLNILIGLVALLIIGAIVATIAKKYSSLYRGFFKRIYNFSAANLIIGLVVIFFNYENVPFFSSRMWIAIWLIEMIVWKFFILKEAKRIPKNKKELEAEKELKKYLP